MKSDSFLNLDFDRLKTFYLIASERSFTKAALLLGVDKSSVSRQLQLLEDELQAKLIVRSHRDLQLTSAGEFVFEKAQKVVEELKSIHGYLGQSSQVQGLFRLTTTHALLATWFESWFPSFVEMYPLLRFELVGSNKPLDLTTGQFDAAIRPFMEGSPHYIQEPLMRWRLNLFASQAYIDRFGMPQTADDLDEHRLIVFGDSSAKLPHSYTSWPLHVGKKRGQTRKPFVVLNSVPGMYQLVSAGLGIGCFSKDSPVFKQYHLIPVLPDLPSTEVEIYYIYSESAKFLPKIRLLGEFLKQQCR